MAQTWDAAGSLNKRQVLVKQVDEPTAKGAVLSTDF